MEDNNQQSTTAQPNGQMQRQFTENTVDKVLQKLEVFKNGGGLKMPENYNAENAVRSAWLMIQEVQSMDKQPALKVCSTESIANALLNMVLQGLSPVKKQCYFIVYGNKLVLQKSYIGTIAVSKRLANVKEVKGVSIYEGDTFKFNIDLETGRKQVTEHGQDFENIDPDKTKGAYAIVTFNDGTKFCEIMNMKQIRAAWALGNARGGSPAHKNFADEMACKTVINRALKVAVGSSDDGDLYDDQEITDPVAAKIGVTIENNANKTPIEFNPNVDTQTGEIIEPLPQQEEDNIQQPELQQQPQEITGHVVINHKGQQITAPF